MTAELGVRTVAEVMVRRPKTLPASASVGEVRALLADDHVHLALLVRDGDLVGTVARADLDSAPDSARGAGPALDVATLDGRTVSPRARLAPVHTRMVATGRRRLAVVDDEGRLVGLLCLKRTLAGFCSDRDVASRAEELSARTSPCRLPLSEIHQPLHAR